MKTYKLQFEEVVRSMPELIIETDLSFDELDELIDEIDLHDCTLDDAAYCLKRANDNIIIKELLEADPWEWSLECTDLSEIEEKQ